MVWHPDCMGLESEVSVEGRDHLGSPSSCRWLQVEVERWGWGNEREEEEREWRDEGKWRGKSPENPFSRWMFWFEMNMENLGPILKTNIFSFLFRKQVPVGMWKITFPLCTFLCQPHNPEKEKKKKPRNYGTQPYPSQPNLSCTKVRNLGLVQPLRSGMSRFHLVC